MVLDVQTSTQTQYEGQKIVNDFSLTAATKNGTGSQTSNNVLVFNLSRCFFILFLCHPCAS